MNSEKYQKLRSRRKQIYRLMPELNDTEKKKAAKELVKINREIGNFVPDADTAIVSSLV